ncbi:hypothetical protein LPJ63_002821 [Coemansia sp. RSA 2711]|nr:hypothetical protein LPJ63_002821 [Coemansia sp. RSA 2711]
MPEDELAYSRLLSTRYARLVFLGDSNADNGNVLRLTNGAHPQPSSLYWQGRYSDGKVWADYLAEAASPAVAINLAYGCATIDNEIVSGTVAMADGRRVEVPSVADQTGELERRIGRLNPTDLTALGTEVCLRLFDTYSVQKQIGLVAGAADSERVPDPTLFIDGCHLGTRAQAEIYRHVLEAIARDMI